MKVQIRVGIASAEWSYAPKQIVDIDDVMGRAWCESGVAVLVAPSEPPRRPVLVIEGGEHDGGYVDLNDVTLEYALQQLGDSYELVDGDPPRIVARAEAPAPEVPSAQSEEPAASAVVEPTPESAPVTPSRGRRR